MKVIFISIICALAIGIGISACSSEPQTHARSIYMMLDTSKKSLADENKLSQTLSHVINDLSPGDSLAINTSDEVLSIDFSKDAAIAYTQKRDFRRKMIGFIKNIKPKFKAKFLPSIAKAKAFLDKKLALKKSIIFLNTHQRIALHTKDLTGYTISLFNFKNKDFSRLKSKVETAHGSFVVASNLNELNQVLAYR